MTFFMCVTVATFIYSNYVLLTIIISLSLLHTNAVYYSRTFSHVDTKLLGVGGGGGGGEGFMHVHNVCKHVA